jgi:hypothetical protein
MTVGAHATTGIRAMWTSNRERLHEAYDTFRSRYVFRTCDAVVPAGLSRPKGRGPGEHARGTEAYRRAQRLVGTWAQRVPAAYEWARRRLLDDGRLPIASDGARLLDYGSGTTVFLLHVGHRAEPRVLKVYRKTLGRRLDVLLAHAGEQRAAYRTAVAWYDGCGLLLPTSFLVVHAPVLSVPALACLQPYVAEPSRDLFTGIGEEDLVQLLGTHPGLRAQFVRFVRRTLAIAEGQRTCIDLVGHNNVALIGTGGECRLILFEHGGVYDFERKRVRNPGALSILMQRLEYLRRVCDRVAGPRVPSDASDAVAQVPPGAIRCQPLP